MTQQKTPEIPDNTCSYERYDPVTLRPTNDSTTIRLLETGWDTETFRAKTVLDIGCNSGALSIFAVQNGAKHVTAVDVQARLVAFFKSVVDYHSLAITVRKASLDELDPSSDASDIVLCMEVLHWIVHQGGSLEEAIAKLASLARETLFIETPWDTNEPSIRNRNDYPTHEYDIETIILELSRHFERVTFKRFMSYFGEMKGSKRILIEASGKRAGASVSRFIEDGTVSTISLGRGINESYLVTSRSGTKVIKKIDKNSIFARSDKKLSNEICEFLSTPELAKIMAPPLRVGGEFVRKDENGASYMLFPFVGNLSDYFPKKVMPMSAADPFSAAQNLALMLSQAPIDLIAKVHAASPSVKRFDPEHLSADLFQSLMQSEARLLVAAVADPQTKISNIQEDSIIHNDLQMGNFVRTGKGVDCIVDIDLLRSGPLYADILSAAIYLGVDYSRLKKALDSARTQMNRPENSDDFLFASTGCLNWLTARSQRSPALSDRQFQTFVYGLETVCRVWSET